MVKKTFRKARVGKKNRTAFNRRRPKKTISTQDALGERILLLLSGRKKPLSTAAIMQRLDLPSSARNLTAQTLAALVRSGKIRKKNKKYLNDNRRKGLKATLSLTNKGYGFAVLADNINNEKDIFIRSDKLAGASHGDSVLIAIEGRGHRGRREGAVIEILKRAVTNLCGIYVEEKRGGHLVPDDPKLPFMVYIPPGKARNAKDGIAVLARITDYGDQDQEPRGEILEILGDPLTVSVQLRMAMEKLRLPRFFPKEVLNETDALQPLTTCKDGRRDLRHIPHVTIDGDTAKDFDDAIAVKKTKEGYRLYVSIADVSHYVRPDTALDREAYQRGTSVYFPDLVIPMLPERLSNDLCSLVPHQDRPAFTAILDFNNKGHRLRAKYCRSMINSRMRFTYDTVYRLLFQGDKNEQAAHADLLKMLTAAKKLSRLLRTLRARRGSLGFTIPEPVIELDGDKIRSISNAQRNEAHLLIEDFMLAANEAVAETLDKAGQKVLFRVHEPPDPEKVKIFTEAAAAMGLTLAKTEITPAWFARILDEARGKPAEYVVNNLLLRTMQQARYSVENLGHFGLAAKYYLHFTSPIRRYPDLIAHRALHNFLLGTKKKENRLPLLSRGETLAQAAVHLSNRERVAVEAERDVQARLSCLFLRERVGEKFKAVISGVTSFGLFVELMEYFISGAVPMRAIPGDYYHFDSRAHRLIGERTNTIYQLGQIITVQLDHIDMRAKRITFSLVDNEQPDKGKK